MAASPTDTYDRPTSRFVASFVGNPPMNFVDVEMTRHNGRYLARAANLEVEVAPERGRKAVEAGRRVVLGIRPEDLQLSNGGHGIRGTVLVVEPLGREDLVVVGLEGAQLRALLRSGSGLRAGESVSLLADPERVQLFDPSSGRSVLWA